MPEYDFSIRQMVEDDLAAVAEVEAGVFTDWYRAYRRDPEPLPERTRAELRFASSRDPKGNFVAIARDGAMAGFIFSRTWGSVGWFGTFGVPTQLQGLGVGKALVARTVDHLRGKATTIGLETMPESGANLGLYTKAGFVAAYPTVVLELSLIHEAERLKALGSDDPLVWDLEDVPTRAAMLEGVRAIGHSHVPGLDYTSEVEAIREHGFGETLLATDGDGRVDGFAVLRTAPFRGDDTSGRAYLHILAVAPEADSAGAVSDLLHAVWVRATKLGFSKLVTGLSARYHDALTLLLNNGFHARRAAIRMVERGGAQENFLPASGVNVSRWAG